MAASDTPDSRIPKPLIAAVIAVSVAPVLLHLLGIDFGTAPASLAATGVAGMTPSQFEDAMFHRLAGAFSHTILEWSAFCTAIFTVILAFVHFSIKRDVATPVIGLALFFAGSMDAFHTLAADRLIEAVADNRDLIPFTWAICRSFNALIMICGVALFLLLPQGQHRGRFFFIALLSMLFGGVAYGIIHYAATSSHLPQTTFADALITRPYDVAPLVLFLFARVAVYPRLHRRAPSVFTHALIISVIPEVATQLHMVFGSTALFDAHFNMAHFLKIVAYLVPFGGLSMDYIRTYRAEQRTVALLEKVEADVTRRSEQLQKVNADLGRKDAERQRVEDALRNREQELKQLNEDLEKIVDERTSETRTAYEELKQAESQLVQSGKLASIGQLAAGVAHEINNPVGFIQSNLVTLREYAEDLSKLIASYGSLENHLANGDAAAVESAREELSQLKEKMDLDYVLGDLGSLIAESLDGVERVGKIVQNLRDFSQVDKGERELADLNKGLESTLNIVWNELKYKATVQKNYGDIPKIMCSPMELNQVFMNILVNAAQAIEDRGTVTISSYCEDDHVCVAISDTGKGMSAEVQERIFEPFYTTKDVGKGTGLGLHVSYNIVKKHDGELLVESQEGVGTTFTIRLPIDRGDHHE